MKISPAYTLFTFALPILGLAFDLIFFVYWIGKCLEFVLIFHLGGWLQLVSLSVFVVSNSGCDTVLLYT